MFHFYVLSTGGIIDCCDVLLTLQNHFDKEYLNSRYLKNWDVDTFSMSEDLIKYR